MKDFDFKESGGGFFGRERGGFLDDEAFYPDRNSQGKECGFFYKLGKGR